MVQQATDNPSLKELTALGFYLLMCLGFVAAAMAQFAITLWVSKSTDGKNGDKSPGELVRVVPQEIESATTEGNITRNTVCYNFCKKIATEVKIMHRYFDMYSLFLFVMSFLLFNLIYWPLFLSK